MKNCKTILMQLFEDLNSAIEVAQFAKIQEFMALVHVKGDQSIPLVPALEGTVNKEMQFTAEMLNSLKKWLASSMIKEEKPRDKEEKPRDKEEKPRDKEEKPRDNEINAPRFRG